MRKSKKQDHLQAIKKALAPFDASTQREILWSLLLASFADYLSGIGWLMRKIKEFMDDGEKKFLESFR